MTPKEKAEELATAIELSIQFHPYTFGTDHLSVASKQCALIAVEEILKITPATVHFFKKKTDLSYTEYWQEVKEEVNKL